MGKEKKIHISHNYRLGDIRHNYADITKIRSKLNFEPEIGFSAGIERFVNWVNEQEINNDGYEQSIGELKLRGLFK